MKSCENFSQKQKFRISLLSDTYNYNIDGYVTFIPGIMNFIDDEEQPLFFILKVNFVVKLSNVKHTNLMKKTLISCASVVWWPAA